MVKKSRNLGSRQFLRCSEHVALVCKCRTVTTYWCAQYLLSTLGRNLVVDSWRPCLLTLRKQNNPCVASGIVKQPTFLTVSLIYSCHILHKFLRYVGHPSRSLPAIRIHCSFVDTCQSFAVLCYISLQGKILLIWSTFLWNVPNKWQSHPRKLIFTVVAERELHVPVLSAQASRYNENAVN
jgi:hypothetical protein